MLLRRESPGVDVSAVRGRSVPPCADVQLDVEGLGVAFGGLEAGG